MPVIYSGLSPARAVLPNGLTVLAKRTPTTPAVTIHASVRAGSVYDPPGGEGLAYFTARMLDRGTEMRTADTIAEELDSRGASLSISTSRHTINVMTTCLVEDFDAVLAVVADVLMRPVFPPNEVDTRRGEIITSIKQDEDNPAAVAADMLMQLLYGAEHPYGWRIRGSVENVERTTPAALLDFHRTRFRPAEVSVAVVGDLDATDAVARAGSAFAEWKSTAAVDVTLAEPASTAHRVVRVMPMMNKAQVDIAYGFVAIRRSDPTYYACAVMNNILGQYSLGGRLGDSIRETQGMAYYVFSSLDANLAAGPLVVRAGVSPANVERAVTSIDAELARLAADGPTSQELKESIQYLVGSLPRTLETNIGVAQFLQTVELFGLGRDYDVRLPDLLQAVTREEVHAAAGRFLDPRKAAIAVAGPYDSKHLA